MNTNYIIYAHISPSRKYYIGQTKVGVDQRWGNNGYNYTTKRSNGNYRHPAFAKAILKYGWDKFEHKILFSGLSKIEADMIEEDLIWYYKKNNKSYNIALGGEGGDSGYDFSGDRNPFYGKHHSEESKKRISNAKAGKSLPSKRKIAVVQETLDGSFVNRFDSITKAVEVTGVKHIWDVLKGKYRTAGGFVWKYE